MAARSYVCYREKEKYLQNCLAGQLAANVRKEIVLSGSNIGILRKDCMLIFFFISMETPFLIVDLY